MPGNTDYLHCLLNTTTGCIRKYEFHKKTTSVNDDVFFIIAMNSLKKNEEI